MLLGKVISPVVCTVKDKNLEGLKLFVVQPLNSKLEAYGNTTLALYSTSAGPGDIVVICREGQGSRQALSRSEAPVNSVIVGIVDQI